MCALSDPPFLEKSPAWCVPLIPRLVLASTFPVSILDEPFLHTLDCYTNLVFSISVSPFPTFHFNINLPQIYIYRVFSK